jgi:lipopolysaccharide/colanic/teichoic acid biosynthesis glycosyltransferase
VHQTPLIGWGRLIKRLFDVVASGLALIILSPAMLLIALAIRTFDPGPAIFRQQRITRFNRQFTAYKFRTMKVRFSGRDPFTVLKELGREDLIEEFNKYQQLKDDPRVSGLGGWLRRSSLDELPQLLNVLKGDISLVGPRARLLEELRFYKGKESLLLSVKTGLTGLAQVSGRSEISFEERVKLDLFYVQNWSFWLDVKIISRTVVDVLTGRGTR